MMRPVLYLDLDDTVLSWADGRPVGAPGVREFLLWALDSLEVRWLTRWARTGHMSPELLVDLAKLTDVPAWRLAHVRGLDWEQSDSKLDGLAWLEHTVLARPFFWLEDALPQSHLDFLDACGLSHSYLHCDVTRDPEALRRAHQQLQLAHSV